MSPTRCITLLMLVLLLAGCGQQSADERLNQSLTQLQEAIESRSADQLVARLHPDFMANQQYDRDWARRTASLLFLQNQRVNLLVISQQTSIDPVYTGQARTQAQINLSGAQRFIPDSTRLYSVTLNWLEEDGEWLLHRLTWE
ncbi:MAG: hypothetical protein CVV07_10725 [Gammaproteobacteria bacterium HGW-Gammaproteobacteria-11]|nr:MAG: hypothetical protein CVV07_10725 [Gammaproteobacteria bacterium HGW-Gammaproteobacteria-11]